MFNIHTNFTHQFRQVVGVISRRVENQGFCGEVLVCFAPTSLVYLRSSLQVAVVITLYYFAS